MAAPLPPHRGQIRVVAGEHQRRVLVYSGNMFNELPNEPYVITMDVTDGPVRMGIELPDGYRVAYTRLDHIPKVLLADTVGEVSPATMESINTRLFMVLTTK
jgi:hypothetical protein